MARSQYTVYQTLASMRILVEEIASAKRYEECARDQLHDSIDTSKQISIDPWDQWRSDKASRHIDSDTRWYQSCIRKRMKLEKELRRLESRLELAKLQSNTD